MFIKNPFPDAFGLDIGDLSLKLVQLTKIKNWSNGDHFKIKYSNVIPLPPGYIVNGEIQQPEMVRKKLMQLLGKEGVGKKITSPWVVADLPEPQTFLTSIEFNLLPEQITREDVEYQCKKHLPFDLEEAYIDYQIIDTKNNPLTTRILIGAVPKKISDAYTYLLESAGLQPLALEIEALALARALADDSVLGAHAILDLGATRSAIIIYDKGGVRFSTSINFSGELITTALQQELKLEYKQADDLKIKNGLNYDKECPRYLKIVDELVNNLIADIKKILTYYQNHYSFTAEIEQISLCGGMTEMQNLHATISRRLKIRCVPGTAWSNIKQESINDNLKKNGLTLVSATGLAMRAALNPYTE